MSRDGLLILTLGDSAKLWEIATGRLLARWDASAGYFSPDSRLVATTDGSRNDPSVQVRDARTGAQVATLRSGIPTNLTFAADSRLLAIAVGGVKGSSAVSLWEPHTGHEVSHLRDPESDIASASLDPGGRWLISRSRGVGSELVRVHSWEQFAPIDDLLQAPARWSLGDFSGAEVSQFLHQ